MTAGIQIFNDGHMLQITSETRHPAMIQNGRFSGPGGGNARVVIGHAAHQSSCPMLLLRPDPGSWIGGVIQFHDQFWVHSFGPCDYALFSTEGTPVVWPGSDGAGLQIFDEFGRLAYSTAFRFARLQNIVQYVFPGGGGATRVQIGTGINPDAWGRRPWVDATDLTVSKQASSGADYVVPRFGYTLEMPSNGSAVIVGWRDFLEWDVLPNWSEAKSYDIYTNGRPLRLPMCYVPGV
jgi:hypothetical protein